MAKEQKKNRKLGCGISAIVVAVLAIIVVVIATSGDPAPKDTTEDAPAKVLDATTATPKDIALSLNQPATLRDLTITALEVKSGNGDNQLITPSAGNTLLAVKFEVENTSDSAQNAFSTAMFATYADDTLTPFSTSAATALGDLFFGGGLDAGKKMILWYSVEAPSTWSVLEVKAIDGLLFSSQDVTFKFYR